MRTQVKRNGPSVHLPRHRHANGYAALVLAGGYLESGDAGRFRVGAGDVLLHGRFEAHQDVFGSRGARLVDLPLAEAPGFSFGTVDDADAIVRLAEKDAAAAARILFAQVRPSHGREKDWPDCLADDLRADRVDSLGSWASANGLRASSLSRGFRLAYGVSPQRYLFEARARRAAQRIVAGGEPLARIAAATGFADQPHMARAIRSICGVTPGTLRRHDAHCVQ